MPYKGNETLVFISNLGETDTIFILKKDTLLAFPEAQSPNGLKLEEVSVFCNHHNKDALPSSRSYYLFKIQRSKDGNTNLIFDLSTKGAVFYRITPISIDILTKINPKKMDTSYDVYNDVYLIEPDEYGRDFSNRANYVTKLYWSKSKGLIRYDKNDNLYWELKSEN